MLASVIKENTQENTQESASAASRIADTLRQRIQQGAYLAGSCLPAERDLAAEFALDRSAVRAALAQLTRAGLITRAPGCRPRVSAPSAHRLTHRPAGRRRESAAPGAIAVVLPQHQADHGSREIMRGISSFLRSENAAYRALIFDTNPHTAPRAVLEREACAAIPQEQIAGAIVWPTLEEDSLARWRQVQAAGHPVVFVDRSDDQPCDFVGVDNFAAAKEGVDYLLRLGHTRIVHLTHALNASSVQERAAGYRAAMQSAGLTGDAQTLWTLPSSAPPWRLDEFFIWLQEASPAPTAVFAINDQIAHLLIAGLEARGLRVPEDFSVLGFDDDDMYSARPALLTTLRQPFERIGQRAAALLLRRLEALSPPSTFQHILLPTLLVERSTCGCPK